MNRPSAAPRPRRLGYDLITTITQRNVRPPKRTTHNQRKGITNKRGITTTKRIKNEHDNGLTIRIITQKEHSTHRNGSSKWNNESTSPSGMLRTNNYHALQRTINLSAQPGPVGSKPNTPTSETLKGIRTIHRRTHSNNNVVKAQPTGRSTGGKGRCIQQV